MTENVTTLQAPANAVDVAPDIEFAHLDPRTLVVDANVRTTVVLDPGFVGTIRKHGVVQPIVAVRYPDGEIRVRMGQRRTLGAIEAGVATIPVRIMDAGPGVERLIFQMIENDQREGVTEAERVAAYEEMHLDFGLTASQIAGNLGAPKRTVATALRIAKSAPSRAAVVAGLTLDQAAAIAAFDTHPDVHAHLTSVAMQDPNRLAHAVQKAKDDLAEARLIASTKHDLTEAGVTVLDWRPDYSDETIRAVSDLRHEDGHPLTDAEHAVCPGHAAFVSKIWWQENASVTYYCTDYAANGHERAVARIVQQDSGPSAEEKKAERRAVIAGNKAWRSATTVRREWLAAFAKRRTAPKGAPQFISRAVLTLNGAVHAASQDGHPLALDLLGLTNPDYYPSGARTALAEAYDTATPGRAQVIATTFVLAALESGTSDRTWRDGSAAATAYLRAIESWGYTLADIEVQAITGQPVTEPDDADVTHEDPEPITDGLTDDLNPDEYEADDVDHDDAA